MKCWHLPYSIATPELAEETRTFSYDFCNAGLQMRQTYMNYKDQQQRWQD
jgi:hypothetical protein